MTPEPTPRNQATTPPTAGLPLLGRGAHPDPRSGACLMEATALLAGEPHTDRPASVHPVLAALARVVNDAVSDTARPALLPLAPELIGTAAADPQLIRALVELCCRRAQTIALPIWAPRLRRDLRRAEAGKPFSVRCAVRTVTLAAASIALATHEDRDQVLTDLLTDATRLACTTVGRYDPDPVRQPQLAGAPRGRERQRPPDLPPPSSRRRAGGAPSDVLVTLRRFP